MKRLLTLAAMFLCCVATTFAQFSGSGSGTESDPYLILNPIQLNQLRNYLNQSKVYFKLMANIDLTEFIEDENPSQGWQPIGTTSTPFKGILDGNGKTISGLWINRSSSDYVGLFGCTNGATIKNLTLNGTSIKGKTYVSLLTAHSTNTTISDCNLSASLSGASYVGGCGGWGKSNTISNVSSTIEVTSSGDYAGGIIGYTEGSGSISESRVTCNNIIGVNNVGGICGANRGSNPLNTCHVQATVNGNDHIGGIIGQIDYGDSHMTSCSFCGDVNGSSFVGGICGRYASLTTMKGCYAVAHVIASGNEVGGLIGANYSSSHYNLTLLNSYFSGSVSGNEQVGGLIGHAYSGKTKYCYANTIVNGKKAIGGLIGKTEGRYGCGVDLISNVAICSSVKATEGNVGRVYGEKGNYVTIGEMGTANENKAWNRAIVINAGVAQDITDDAQNGSGVSKTTLKLKATYVAMGWDFTDTWEIQETECYPYMKSQTAPPVITSQLVSGATTISGKCVDGGTVTLEVDGVKQQMVSTGHEFSFNVSPLQAGHEVRISAKAESKEQSYYTTEVVSYLGKGTEADPYQVYTASDLTGVYRKGYFKLMNDIDLTSYINQFSPSEGWESIGREGSETIHFDGNGHKITGLWCNSTRDNTGLFSCFANGTIKNLTVETAKGKQVKGGANTGILIGKMINGTIENCHVSGTVADGTPVGGLVGLFDGGKISLSQANVTVNTTLGTSYVGGLVGEITGGEIDQCVTQGTITATGKESYVGGLVGKNSATVTNSYSNAIVTSPYNAAGLIAYNYGVVDKCYATGDIFSNNYGAGVIGYNDGENAVVKNCVAMNNKIDVTWESQQQQQGGGYGQRIIGGIKNGAPAPELNNYALKTMQVSVNNVAQKVYDDIMNGVAKTDEDFMKASTYQELGWNFTDLWTITAGEGYPSLKNISGNTGNEPEPDPDPDPDPNPDPNPDPDPVVVNDDAISVNTVSALVGETVGFDISLENQTNNLTAYQFELTLPQGIALAKNVKGKFLVSKTSRYDDDDQSLSISLVQDNTYKFVCYSMCNGIIEGNTGAILNAILQIAEDIQASTYVANIRNIVFTQVDGTQLRLNDVAFNIEVKDYIMGDANGDGEVNVTDIVEIVNAIMNKTSAKFVRAAADMNNDNDINVTDIVLVVNIILGTTNNSRAYADNTTIDNDQIALTVDENQMLQLSLENTGRYVAAQFDVRLAEGQTLENVRLNDERKHGHQVLWAALGNNSYRVIVYDMSGNAFSGNNGELLTMTTSGEGYVTLENIIFVTDRQVEKKFAPLSVGTTGIKSLNALDAPADIYTTDGRLVRKQTTSTIGLKKGIYIIDNRKVIVR